MSIEMINRSVTFTWNNGAGTKSVTHPCKIHTNDDQHLNDERWYIIEAQR